MKTLRDININALLMAQEEHNRRQHPDVNERNGVTQKEHYMHHLHKYAGKAQAMNLTGNNTPEDLQKLWADTTLITLSLTNCVSHTLRKNLSIKPDEIPFAELISAPKQPVDMVTTDNIVHYFATYLTFTSSIMASAFDKLYHGEKTPTPDISHYHVIHQSLDALFHTCMLVAEVMGWHMESEVRVKHHEIFEKKIA